MIRTEGQNIMCSNILYEVNIDRHRYIAEAYGIHAVPTLISGTNIISGLPSAEELHSFLLQSVSNSPSEDRENRPRSVIRTVSDISGHTTSIERIVQ